MQAALEWRKVLTNSMKNLGFETMITDPGSFIGRFDAVLMNSQVDDLNAIGKNDRGFEGAGR